MELWVAKRAGRVVPSWHDFDFMDFQPWWGWIATVDYHFEPFDFSYRLYGTKLVETFQQDNTGKFASALQDELGDLSDDLIFYEKIASEMLIARSSGTLFWQNRWNVRVEVLELPLSDTGERATHGLSLMHRLPTNQMSV